MPSRISLVWVLSSGVSLCLFKLTETLMCGVVHVGLVLEINTISNFKKFDGNLTDLYDKNTVVLLPPHFGVVKTEKTNFKIRIFRT